VLPAEHASKIVPGGNGVFMVDMLVNGQVVGTWKRAIAKRALRVTLAPFEKHGRTGACCGRARSPRLRSVRRAPARADVGRGALTR